MARITCKNCKAECCTCSGCRPETYVNGLCPKCQKNATDKNDQMQKLHKSAAAIVRDRRETAEVWN